MVRKRQAFEGAILIGFSVCQKSAGAPVVHGRNAVQMRVAATALTDQSREVSLRSEWQVPHLQFARQRIKVVTSRLTRRENNRTSKSLSVCAVDPRLCEFTA